MREQGLLDPARLVFIDETAVSTNLVRLNGRAPRGERVIGSVPLGTWQTITFVAALRHDNSPDLNPIELPYSKFKAFLRKVAARTVPALNRAIRSFIPQLTPQECANYFKHAGYASI